MIVRDPTLKCRSLLVCLAVLVFAACQPFGEEDKPARQELVLRHYFSFSGTFSRTMDSLGEDFNRSSLIHALRSEAVDHESFKRNILEDLNQGKTADLYSYWAGARVQAIVGKLAPIDGVLTVPEMNALFGSAIVQSACTYDGRVYLLPLTQHYVGFFYNKKVFKDHGLEPPKNWQEFLLLGRKLKSQGITPVALGAKAKWPAQFWFDYLLLRTAPLSYRQKLMAGEASLTDPEVMRVFALWNDLIKAGMFNANPGALEFDSGAAGLVYRGEAAMTLMGTWLMGYFNAPEQNWHENQDYGFFSFPEVNPGVPLVALGPIDGLVLPVAAANPEGAKTVLRYFSSAAAQVTISRATGSFAPNLVVAERHYSPMQQMIRGDIARTSAWAFNYDLATAPERAEIGLQLFADFLQNPAQYPGLLKEAQARMARIPSAAQGR